MATKTQQKVETVEELLATKRTDLFWLDPRVIKVMEGFNDRIDYGNMDELVQSIRENGIRIPLKGFQDKGEYFVTVGHRRLQAAMILLEQGETIRVPFMSSKKTSMEEMLIESFLSNDGKRFTAIEEASLVSKLIKHGLTPKEIANKLGRTPSHISNLVKLASLPTKLKNSIASEEIRGTLVLEIMRTTHNLSIDEIAEQIQKLIDNKLLNDGTKKVTKKDVDKSNGKTNSFSAIKKALKLATVRDLKPEAKPFFELLQKFNNGEYTFEQIVEELYEPRVEK